MEGRAVSSQPPPPRPAFHLPVEGIVLSPELLQSCAVVVPGLPAETEGPSPWGPCLKCTPGPAPESPGPGISIVRSSPNYSDAGLTLLFGAHWPRSLTPASNLVLGHPKFLLPILFLHFRGGPEGIAGADSGFSADILHPQP